MKRTAVTALFFLFTSISTTSCLHLMPKMSPASLGGGSGGGGGGGGGSFAPSPLSFEDREAIEKFLTSREQQSSNKNAKGVPTGVQMMIDEVMPGRDVISPLIPGNSKSCASISTDNSNEAMNYEKSFLDHNLKNEVVTYRHSTLFELIQNIVDGCRDKKSIIIGAHGFPGVAGAVNEQNADLIGRAIRLAGAHHVIFSSCSTGANQAGKDFLTKISEFSGAAATAWDKTLWNHSNDQGVQIAELGGKRVTAIPEFSHRDKAVTPTN